MFDFDHNDFPFNIKLDASVLILVILVGSYIITCFYLTGYYRVFGIYQSVLELTPDQVIIGGMFALFFCFLLCLAFLWGITCEDNKNWGSFIVSNVPIFLLIADAIIFLIFPSYNQILVSILCIALLIVVSVFFIFAIYQNSNYIQHVWKNSIIAKILILTLFIFGLSLAAMAYGEINAKSSIQCTHQYCAHVIISFKDPSLSSINSPDLILITRANGKYILTYHMNPAPDNPKTYLISDEAIQSIQIIPIRNWSTAS